MYICGQTELKEKIIGLSDSGSFPKFSIICGEHGHGKKVMSEYISHKLGATLTPCKSDIASVRSTIAESYMVADTTLYMFFDCDEMSVGAKNALLKITEDPPTNAYFIMTVCDIETMLPTLISRGVLFHLDPYSVSDIDDFIKEREFGFTETEKAILRYICTCPNDVVTASKCNISSIYDLSDRFIQFIGASNLSNELKISQQLNLKKDADETLIDPIMFLRCVLLCSNEYMIGDCTKEDAVIFDKIIRHTAKAVVDISRKGSIKQIVLDNYIINLHLAIAGGI